MPENLLSASDIGDLFGVSRQYVDQLLRRRQDFPRPLGIVSGGKVRVWDRAEVEAWHTANPEVGARAARRRGA